MAQGQPQVQPRSFAYAHSNAIKKGLILYAKSIGHHISDDYAYVDEPGKTDMFQAMLEIAALSKKDILYVNSIKEFAGASLSEFKGNLAAIEKAGMRVNSLSEPNYNYSDFQTVIQVLEDLTPGYQKNYQQSLAAILYELGISVQDIVEQTDLSESDVYQAIAEHKREQERRRKQEQEDEG